MEMENKEATKLCSKCGRELPVSEFYASHNRVDGLQIYCKSCHKAMMQSNRQRKMGGGGRNAKRSTQRFSTARAYC
jgi:hypothetical protein